jgi:hypothetical protein
MAEASCQPLAKLVVLVTDGHRTLRLSPEGMLFWKAGSSEPNPLPEVTDPEFLLVETVA